jgi:neutral ceramidase
MSQTWKAGTAAAVITPEAPLWLAGYGGIRQAEGKRHDLWVKTLALEDGEGRRAGVLTSDLVGFSRGTLDRLHEALAHRHGLTPDRIMLTYSHNHCAPVTSGVLVDYYPLDDSQWRQVADYSRWLEECILEVIDAAFSHLAPATLAAGSGAATFAVNRRNNREAEVPDLQAQGLPLRGPVDHRVPLLAVRGEDGDLSAILFGYACHTTTLNDTLWCGD